MTTTGAPPWLDDREARAWRSYLAMQRRLEATINRRLQQGSGLSGADYEVLVHLSEAEDQRMRAFELAEATQWEKSRLSHHLTRMERRGLVERSDCPTDRRGAFVSLTRYGQAAIEAAAPCHVADVRSLFLDELTPLELDTLAGLTERVLARLDAAEAAE
jgi:DNA-binding MarR family transcriptional regulator